MHDCSESGGSDRPICNYFSKIILGKEKPFVAGWQILINMSNTIRFLFDTQRDESNASANRKLSLTRERLGRGSAFMTRCACTNEEQLRERLDRLKPPPQTAPASAAETPV